MLRMAHRYHHGDLRAALLERAERVLEEHGSAALSLRELARDIGVSHAAPNRHFRDKSALLDALALRGFQRLGDHLEQATQQGSFTVRLTAFSTNYVHFALANPELIELMWARKHGPQDLRDAVRAACAAPISMILEAQASGEVVNADTQRIGLAVFAMAHGYADLAANGVLERERVAETLAEGVVDLMRGLRPRE